MRAFVRSASLAVLVVVTATRADAQSASTSSIDLKQNWTDELRQEFWFTSQGSRLIPYSWFLHLEQASAAAPFRDPANMERLGYVPAAASMCNPDALPIGFVKDIAADNTEYVGFTCAACHTSVLKIRDTPVLVEGAPALADFSKFMTELVDALEATLNTSAKLTAFTRKTGATDAQLKEQRDALRLQWINKMPPGFYGPGRLDAFGGLYNQVVAYALGVDANAQDATAPVSYPFLWDTPQHDKVQWNGSASNGLLGLGPVFRNIGEALGVFGVIRLKRVPEYEGPLGSQKYQSSIRVDNLIRLENIVKRLRSPVWPEDLLRIDRALAAGKGEALYRKHCKDCHKIVDRVATGRIKAKMKDVGTDAAMAVNYADRFTEEDRAQTGLLEGAYKTFKFVGRFKQRSPGGDIFANAILGVYLGKDLGGLATPSSSAAAFEDPVKTFKEISEFSKSLRQSKREYKARPLNGIWATAPYLHNGSVPTVRELLNEPCDRVQQFYVGSRDFDDKNLGLSTKNVRGAFLFDTSKPGNSRLGHAYGTTLTDDQKKALLEYLKTL